MLTSTTFTDGTKIEANANKYSWVWKKAVRKTKSEGICKDNRIAW